MNLGLSNIFKKDPKSYPTVKFDESKAPAEVKKLESYLRSKIIGQDRAIKQFVTAYETFISGMKRPDGPIGNLLFLGPTGVGKTRICEVFAEYLWGSSDALIQVDCAEYQHSHEISKLIGAPPGYVGHGDNPAITKKIVEQYWDKGPKFTPILFDEIEKGNKSLHRLLLGILGRGQLRSGKGEVIDLRSTIIIMTSNLGSRSISDKLSGKSSYGFNQKQSQQADLDQDIYKVCREAVKAFFDPELFNRVDRLVAFRPLEESSIRKILDIELSAVQDRIVRSKKFIVLQASLRAKDLLIKEGVSSEFGARELRRTIERYITSKLTRMFSSKQAISGDLVLADAENGTDIDFQIMKNVIDIPGVDTGTTPQQFESWVRPESLLPFESAFKPGKCGRCGMSWRAAHVCRDLELENSLKTWRPPVVSEDFWNRQKPPAK